MNVNDLFTIKGKTALITGGSRGIGLMIAEGYVRADAKVYISSRNEEVCAKVEKDLSKMGDCVAIPADVATNEGRKKLVEEITKREGKLHILVNNAGAAWGEPLDNYSEEGYDKVMDLNVKSVFMLTRDFLALLEKAQTPEDPARVINIGSIDGIWVPALENYAYSPSKAAVHHMTRVFATRIGVRGITFNAIAPGFFESKMTKWVLENFGESLETKCPRKRIGTPEDMAGTAIFLASRAGAYVNGAVITVDGGLHMA
jgi:NAD(P)-dependent dehydrogenase (short-subunit alcohol dehydrogenase family)